ncbi:MAG: DUF423 domain-containing protein [Myxococcota bacterium]
MTPEKRAAAVLGAVGVAMGAFGAHALGDHPRIESWETAARYHLIHAVAMWVAPRLGARLFGAGILLFAGSLYALVLLDAPKLGMITPLGGLAFIAGWLSMLRNEPRP